MYKKLQCENQGTEDNLSLLPCPVLVEPQHEGSTLPWYFSGFGMAFNLFFGKFTRGSPTVRPNIVPAGSSAGELIPLKYTQGHHYKPGLRQTRDLDTSVGLQSIIQLNYILKSHYQWEKCPILERQQRMLWLQLQWHLHLLKEQLHFWTFTTAFVLQLWLSNSLQNVQFFFFK